MEDADLFGGMLTPWNGSGKSRSSGGSVQVAETNSRPSDPQEGTHCLVAEPTRTPQFDDYSTEKKIQDEMKILDFPVTAHPVSLYEDKLRKLGVIPAKDVSHYVGRTIRVAGWLVTTRRVTTVNNEQMRFLTLEDLTDVVEIVLFPKTYRKCGALIQSFGPYLVRGKVEDDNTHSTLTANHLELL
jgi:DNA polymerase III alpha subunit